MKDIVIKGESLRRELFIALGCFLAAVAVNIYAICEYDTSWTELFSQIGFTAVTAIVIYIAVWIIRLLILLCLSTVRKMRSSR